MNNNFLKFGLDRSVEIPKLELTLYRNKQHAISRIKHFYNANHKMTLGEINTLSFEIPQYIEKNNENILNPLFDKFKFRYFVKLKFNDFEEMYYIKKPINKSDSRSKSIELESTVGLLRDIPLYNYNVTSFTIEEICKGNILKSQDGILKDTSWSLGVIDEKLKTKKRGIEMNGSSNVLDGVYQIAKKFNAIIEFDTINETISFYDEEEYGQDNGLVFQYNRYLDTLDQEQNSDELCTILNVKGKDGIGINSINPTGQGSLVDYSYFIYPFERDENKNVVKHSDYFEDDLCHALLDYNELVISNKGKLSNLIKKKSTYDESLTIKEMHLTDLKGELESIESTLNVIQSEGKSTHKLIKNRNKKRKQIKDKQSQVDFITKKIKQTESEINSLVYILSEEKNFTPKQLAFLRNYKITKTYENNNISDPKELMMAAQEDFRKLRMPKQIISINIANLFNFIDAQRDWNKMKVGDKVTINYHRFDLNKVKARIDNINIDYENKDIKLDITTLSYTDANKEIAKKLYNIGSVSAIVSDTRHDIDSTKDQVTELQQVIKDVGNAIKNPILSGSNGSTTIDHVGLTSWNKEKPKMGIRINNGSFQITNNGEDHFKNYIDGNGLVNAGMLSGKIDKDKVQIDVGSIDGLEDFVQSENDKILDELWNQANENYQKVDDLESEFLDKIKDMINDMDDIGSELDDVATDMVGRIDKVAGDLTVYQGKTDTAIQERVKSSEFASYREMTDDRISQVVKDNADNLSLINQNSISISTLVKDNNDNKSIIQQHADSIKTLVINGENMSTSIQQTKSDITFLAKDTKEKYSALNVRAGAIESSVVNVNDDLKSYRVQTDDLIASKVSSSEFESYRTHTADGIADMVKNINGNKSQIAMNSEAIGLKVDNDKFNSEIDILKGEIRSKVSEGEVSSIIEQSAYEVKLAFNDICPTVTINSGGMTLGEGCSVKVDAIEPATRRSKAIINLFNDCSLDGTGGDLRMRYDDYSYVRVANSYTAIYNNGNPLFQIGATNGYSWCETSFVFNSNMHVKGEKTCIQTTKDYGIIKYYAYEDCENWLTDRHKDKLTKEDKKENGLYEKVITIDDKHRESVNLEMDYNVGIYKYGRGDIWSEDLTPYTFKVVAENPIEFTYIIEGKRQGYEHKRNEQYIE